MSRSLTWLAVVAIVGSVPPAVNAFGAEPEPAIDRSSSSPAEKGLDAPAERDAKLDREYHQAAQKAQSPEERLEVYRQLAPDNAMADDYFAFEREHRGQPPAVAVLYRIMSAATGVVDTELPVSKARVRAIEIATSSYAEHPDLDALLTGFEAGAWTPEAENLLREAAKSPHRRVRACAIVRLASWLWHRISLVQAAQQMEELADDSGEERARKESLSKIRDQIGPLDVLRSRIEAIGKGRAVFGDFHPRRSHDLVGLFGG